MAIKVSIELHERESILIQANEAYVIQKEDPEFQEEIAKWDVALYDGLDDD